MEDKPKRFIKCSVCGKKIYLGDRAFKQRGLCGIYCSASCYATDFADVVRVTLDEADNCCKTVYEERIAIEEVPLSHEQIERELDGKSDV